MIKPSDKSLGEHIADEIMNTIERERRINKDDLIAAVNRVIANDGTRGLEHVGISAIRGYLVQQALAAANTAWSTDGAEVTPIRQPTAAEIEAAQKRWSFMTDHLTGAYVKTHG